MREDDVSDVNDFIPDTSAQAHEVIGGRIADAGVEAALALAGAQHIPQSDPMRQQALQAFGVRQAGQFLAGQRGQDRPQLINVLFNLTFNSTTPGYRAASLVPPLHRRGRTCEFKWCMMSDA